jgi:hypothetical protein
MLGSTQNVDMETTRKSDFGRVQIAVLNPSLIPSHLYVIIYDHYFELEFEVEENGEEVTFDWNGGGDREEEGEKEDNLEDETEIGETSSPASSGDVTRRRERRRGGREGEKSKEREEERTGWWDACPRSGILCGDPIEEDDGAPTKFYFTPRVAYVKVLERRNFRSSPNGSR